MRISPLDIRKQAFKKSMRGVDAEEVRIFLELVAAEYEKVLQENAMMAEKIRYQDDRLLEYRDLETSMRNSLVAADRIANESREVAEREAQRTIQDAEMRAERILEDARERLQGLIREIESLRGKKEIYVRRFWTLLESQLSVLSEHGPDMAEVDRLRRRVEELVAEGSRAAEEESESKSGEAAWDAEEALPASPADPGSMSSRIEERPASSAAGHRPRDLTETTETDVAAIPTRPPEAKGGIARSLSRILRGAQPSLPLPAESRDDPNAPPSETEREPEPEPEAEAESEPSPFARRQRREGFFDLSVSDSKDPRPTGTGPDDPPRRP